MIQFSARPTYVLDGDTFGADIDVSVLRGLGLSMTLHKHVRLLGSKGGVNAYELHAADPAVRALALKGQARLAELLKPLDTVMISIDKPDDFSRLLSRVALPDGRDIGDIMLAEKLAVPWGKQTFAAFAASAAWIRLR